MASILILGGSGFIGSNLALHFSRNYNVTVMDNLVRRGSETSIQEFNKKGIEFIHGDIRNIEDFNHLPQKYDFILNTAAQTSACVSYSNPYFDITNNYIGTINALEYARKTEAKFILWSTNKVYNGDLMNEEGLREYPTRYRLNSGLRINENYSIDGGSHSIYGVSKISADLTSQEWAKSFDMNIIINRFSCLAGQRQWGKSEQGWISHFCIASIFGLPVELYGFKGKQVRDILFIDDVIRLIEMEINQIDKFKGEVFNIGGGTFCNASLLECIAIIEKLTRKKIKWSYNENKRIADQCVYISDITKASNLLGWKPKIGLEKGLLQIIKWIKDNEKIIRIVYDI